LWAINILFIVFDTQLKRSEPFRIAVTVRVDARPTEKVRMLGTRPRYEIQAIAPELMKSSIWCAFDNWADEVFK
jgi:hypothetical protein